MTSFVRYGHLLEKHLQNLTIFCTKNCTAVRGVVVVQKYVESNKGSYFATIALSSTLL